MGIAVRALPLLLLVAGCSHPTSPATRPVLQEEGSLLVTVLPLPSDASRLTFRIQGMSAVRDDGTAFPLTLSFTEASIRAVARERRLAARALPLGQYTGIAIALLGAALDGPGGASALQTPREPVTIPVPFVIERRKAAIISLSLDYRRSLEAGFSFNPVFSAAPPSSPAPELLGLASARGSAAVTVFDKFSGRLSGLVPMRGGPAGIVLDQTRRIAHVAIPDDDAIETIGLLEQAVIRRLVLRAGDEPIELALTPDGATLIAANFGAGTVSLIDAVSLVERARLPAGNNPASVLVDRAGQRAWVFNSGASTMTVVDIASRAVVATVSTEPGPIRGQFDRTGEALYVIHRSSPYLTIVDPLSMSVTRRVYVGAGASALKVDARTDRIYIALGSTASVEIFDRLSLLPVDSLPLEGDVSWMTIDDEGNSLHLALSDQDEVRVVGIVSKETVTRIEAGDRPYSIALMGER